MKYGILLINLGTPDAPTTPAVRRYLRQFLNDPRVIDIHPIGRWLLLNLIILPFRPAKSAAAYRAIWDKDHGSPLLHYGLEVRDKLAQRVSSDIKVVLGMRYGNPSIESALKELQAANCQSIQVLPLFPQYSSAATGSAIAETMRIVQGAWDIPDVFFHSDFHAHPAFIDAVAQVSKPHIENFKPDHLLFSYHGLPERHVQKSDDPTTNQCDLQGPCPVIGAGNRYCYRAQCYASTEAIAKMLDLEAAEYSVSFQSRLGRTPWIKPYTDLVLPELYAKGVRKLALISPSFVADCLETVEEIGIRTKAQWLELGGEDLIIVPCLNAEDVWIDGLTRILQEKTKAQLLA
ncbi:MAG: ferrochelatase [Myxococcota bacterium]|nr:ferrochelatase [Myxococcota bacterium]